MKEALKVELLQKYNFCYTIEKKQKVELFKQVYQLAINRIDKLNIDDLFSVFIF